ncbi:hypothetical protein, conserved [Eimeria maxima]|uniref:Sel1 repeat-containing protein n=1 Tax=Eimeria maxima TaxID=5804 RepID=U6M0P5_EIMMA|nr:hypothetical protein, conserved [Eimeria maxima]CDJ57556.1 hypothetical protein, conserved [Eimeria maxima]
MLISLICSSNVAADQLPSDPQQGHGIVFAAASAAANSSSSNSNSSNSPQPPSERELKLSQALELKFGEGGKTQNPRKAATLFKEIIDEDSKDAVAAQALCELGDMELMGMPGLFGSRRDAAAAVKHFAAAAALGYGPAMHALALANAVGLGGLPQAALEVSEQQMRNPQFPLLQLPPSARLSAATKREYREQQTAARQQEDVMQYWEGQAKNDDPVACFELAKLMEQQQQQQQQPQQQQQQQQPNAEEEAKKRRMTELLKKAGVGGMGAALRDLALAYLRGEGIQQNIQQAIQLLEQAAAAGDADAQNYLGYFYWVGTESPPTTANSSNSSSNNSSSSSSSSSNNGFVLKKDVKKAEYYFLLAALQEHPESFFFLGEIKQKEAEKETINKQKKEQAYKTAAEYGVSADSIRKALQLYNEKDYEGSLLINLAAAEEGYEIGQWNSAFLLQSGAAAVPGAAAAAAAAADPDPAAADPDPAAHPVGSTKELQQTVQPHAHQPLSELQTPASSSQLQQQQQQQQLLQQQQQQQQLPRNLVYRQLNRAALQGNVEALREVGLMHASKKDKGVPYDEVLSLQVIHRSLTLGDIQ